MKPKLAMPLHFQGRSVVFYPALPRHVPTFSSPLAPFARAIVSKRSQGCSIRQLRDWVDAQTGWRPGERAIYRLLAKNGERSQ
jgi:hypothetical protein